MFTTSWFSGGSPPPTLSEAAKVLSPKRTSGIVNSCTTTTPSSNSATKSVSLIKEALDKAQAQMEKNASKRHIETEEGEGTSNVDVTTNEGAEEATATTAEATTVVASSSSPTNNKKNKGTTTSKAVVACENTDPTTETTVVVTATQTPKKAAVSEEENVAPDKEEEEEEQLSNVVAATTETVNNNNNTEAAVVTTTTTEVLVTTTTAANGDVLLVDETVATDVISPRTAASNLKKQVDEGDEHQNVQDAEASEMLRAVAAAAEAAERLKQEQAKLEALGLDYDTHCTTLYKLIETKDWKQVMEKLEDETPATIELMETEASQYLYRKDPSKKDKMRWRLLPLHASLIFKAPSNVVCKLCHIYPTAVYLKDDRGMTPLHLAMRHNATDDVIYELLNTANMERIKSIPKEEETKEETKTTEVVSTETKPEEEEEENETKEEDNDTFGNDNNENVVVVKIGLDEPSLGTEPTLPCVLDVTDKRGRKALDLHKAVLGQKATPMSPKQGEGCDTSTSGMSKYVSIMVHDTNNKVVESITKDYEQKRITMEHEKEIKLQNECELYEKQLLNLKDELSAKLSNYLQQRNEIETSSSQQIKLLSKEVKTAQLGAESLIHRYDTICQHIENMHLQVIHTNKRLDELTSGKEGVQSQKMLLTEQFNTLQKQVVEAKAQLEKESEELEQYSNQIEVWNIEHKVASDKLKELTSNELKYHRDNETLTEEIKDLTAKNSTLTKTSKERNEGLQMQLETIVDLELSNKVLKDDTSKDKENLYTTQSEIELYQKKLEELKLVEKILGDVTTRLNTVKDKFEIKSKELDEANVDKWHNTVMNLTEQIVQLKVERDSLGEDFEKCTQMEIKSKQDSTMAKDASNALMIQFQQKVESEAILTRKVKTMEEEWYDEQHPKHQAEHDMLLERKELISKEQLTLKAKRNALEEELYHKTYALERFKLIKANGDNTLSKEDQIQKATLIGNEEKIKLLESMVKELQEKLETKQNLRDELETEYHTKGYHVNKEQLKNLQDTQLLEESKTKELASKLQELNEEHTNLKKELDELLALKEYDLMKLRQSEYQTTNQIQLKQRMAHALEEQLEASQGLSDELQHRLKALEYQHSQMLQGMSNGNYEDLYMNNHQYNNNNQMEDELTMRQMKTYHMQQTASHLRNGSSDMSQFNNNNPFLSSNGSVSGMSTISNNGVGGYPGYYQGMSPDRTMMSSLGGGASGRRGSNNNIMRTGSNASGFMGSSHMDGYGVREQPEHSSIMSKASFGSTSSMPVGVGGAGRSSLSGASSYRMPSPAGSTTYTTNSSITAAAFDRAMEQNAMLQATTKRYATTSSSSNTNNKTYDEASAAINQLRNLGL